MLLIMFHCAPNSLSQLEGAFKRALPAGPLSGHLNKQHVFGSGPASAAL